MILSCKILILIHYCFYIFKIAKIDLKCLLENNSNLEKIILKNCPLEFTKCDVADLFLEYRNVDIDLRSC